MPPPPPRNKALLGDYLPLVSLNKALLGAYFMGGYGIGGVSLDSHDICIHLFLCDPCESHCPAVMYGTYASICKLHAAELLAAIICYLLVIFGHVPGLYAHEYIISKMHLEWHTFCLYHDVFFQIFYKTPLPDTWSPTYTKSLWCLTPLKINMEHNHGGLEDHFPF